MQIFREKMYGLNVSFLLQKITPLSAGDKGLKICQKVQLSLEWSNFLSVSCILIVYPRANPATSEFTTTTPAL
jgi:hypothetical protein